MAEEGGTLGKELGAEFVGTFILILFGNGAVAVSVLAGSYSLWPVSVMWFIGVSLGIYAAGAVSGAYINPDVTVSLAAFTPDFLWRKVGPYVDAQIAGAFVASAAIFVYSAAIFVSFHGVLNNFEATENITRGEPGSQLSAMIFTTYAPNPAIIGTDGAAFDQVSLPTWFFSELIITAVLVFGIMYIIEEINAGRPLANIGPAFIGVLVAGLVAYESPVSMAALNPARDLGPRVFAFFAGWGDIAFPGPRGGFWIPTVSTLVGGLIGGAIYTYLYKRVYPVPAETGEEPPEVRGE